MSKTDLPDGVRTEPVKNTYPYAASQETFLRRALIVIGIVVLSLVLLWILWKALSVFLLIFGGLLLGVFLRALSDGLKRVTHLPDNVVTLSAQVLLGVLAGALGVLFATPLAAAVMVLVKMVYVEDTLGDPVEIKKTVN